ncbi:sodium- and chloride-dependent glycine transporter 2-like isoform X2 [Antedon mediterranea]|uniref:sodium- and chloride-dependent glycine transporter 2-like isoform X2 n=1 Tax=Antedon mediterranea TaxID=105859 RepID=UPI003AF6A70A
MASETSSQQQDPKDKSLSEEEENSTSSTSRGTWDTKGDFLLSCLGYAVGLGNIWRFPYLCYENGGGAFLIPFATMLLLAGLPMFFMELCLGQYSSSGPATVWRISPMFRGMGYGMVLISTFIALYYNVIITYILYYMFASFTNKLPWIGCNNPWNTDMCNGIYDECLSTGNKIMTVNNTCVGVDSLSEEQLDFYNIGLNTLGEIDLSNYIDPLKSKRKLPSEEYFKNAVLHEASGIGDLSTVVWPLLSCLVFAWIIIYFCLQKGIKSSGKVVYFTATFPYIVLVLFLILGLTLEGSYNGIKFFLTPRWEILYEPKVWLDAAIQIFFSLSTSFGGLLTLSSYNRFHNNCYFDAVFIGLANCMTSVFAGVVIFSILGFMANELGREVSEVVDQGFGLAFIAYPEALARLPAAPVWSILFFFMLLTLGLDTQAGVYWVILLDSYSASFVMLTFATMECIIVSWVYGYDRFKEDISTMIGSARVNNKLFNYWRVCWCFITPALLSFVQVYSFANWSAPSYNGGFPTWAHTIGWLITGSTIILVPVFIIVDLRNASGTFLQRLKLISSPAEDWGPLKYEHRALVRKSESSVSTISDLVEQEKGKTSGSTEPNN